MSLKPTPKSKFKKLPRFVTPVAPVTGKKTLPSQPAEGTSLQPAYAVKKLQGLIAVSNLKTMPTAIKIAMQPVIHSEQVSPTVSEQDSSANQVGLENSPLGNEEQGGIATDALRAIASAVIHAIERNNQASRVKRTSRSRATNQFIDLEQAGFLRIGDVLSVFPVSRASWYAGIKAGKYPKSEPLGPRARGWRKSDVKNLIDGIAKDPGQSKRAVLRSNEKVAKASSIS